MGAALIHSTSGALASIALLVQEPTILLADWDETDKMSGPRKLAAILAADVAGYSRLTFMPGIAVQLGRPCLEPG